MPGGFGTLDEVMEAITLVQTGKTRRIPIILVGSEFYMRKNLFIPLALHNFSRIDRMFYRKIRAM
ncbi:MAG: LOG family protein [Rickettsiales bacterium]